MFGMPVENQAVTTSPQARLKPATGPLPSPKSNGLLRENWGMSTSLPFSRTLDFAFPMFRAPFCRPGAQVIEPGETQDEVRCVGHGLLQGGGQTIGRDDVESGAGHDDHASGARVGIAGRAATMTSISPHKSA